MFCVPVTFYFDFFCFPENVRPYLMNEFAANGAKHLVLTDFMIRQISYSPGLGDTLQKEMSSAGLTFVDAHAPFATQELDLICSGAELRRKMILRHKLNLAITSDMGVNTITIHVGNDSPKGPHTVPEYQDNIVQALEELLPEAERLGITVCLENIWFPVNTPESLLEIYRRVPSTALGFCYDSGHANLMAKGKDYPDGAAVRGWKRSNRTTVEWDDHVLEKMLPYIVNCHLHDNNGKEDEHKMPGHGNIDWNHIIGLLKTAPRLQCIQSEVLPACRMESIHDVCEAFRKLGEIPALRLSADFIA